jgi:PAS domain S-box-containing protein
LAVLADHDIVDTAAEASFDGLTRLAAHVIGTPIALVSIVTAERQWFKSKRGIDASETSRDVSFCAHVVASRQPLIVPDALQDARFVDNPLVTGPPYIRFYAGFPLVTREGLVVGSLCVIDRVARELMPEATDLLALLAEQASAQLQLRRTLNEERQTQAKLRHSEERFRVVVANAPFGVVVVQDRAIRYANEAMVRIFGYDDASQIEGQLALALVQPSASAQSEERLRLLASGQVPKPENVECRRRDGSSVWVESTIVPVELDGERAHLSMVRDVTEQLKADEQRMKSKAALRVSLAEKETLLQEVHHRVKNNLQVVASLMNLQANNVNHAGAREVLAVTRQRVQAIALLHEGLYRSRDLGSVDLGPYLRGIVAELQRAHVEPTRSVSIGCEAAGIRCNMDTALPLGLITNELVANSLKHAFVERRGGKVDVRLAADGDLAELRISDNGRGLPELFELERSDSLGLRLVKNLARQLDGELTRLAGIGVSWSVRFPLKGAQLGR